MNRKIIRNPKNIKREVKLKLFYVLDITIIAGMLILANYLNTVLYITGGFSIALYILFGLFGIFLCIKPPNSPTNRNLIVIYHLITFDKNQYSPVPDETIYSSVEKDEQDA